MIYQRLHAKGTLSVAVGELLTGAAGSFVHRSGGVASTPLSANTSAYSQARNRLPVEVAEKVSDWIFEALNERPQILPGLGQPMFLLDGSTILLAHSDDLVACDQDCSGARCGRWIGGTAAVGEQGLAKIIIDRLPADSGGTGIKTSVSSRWRGIQPSGHIPVCFDSPTCVRQSSTTGFCLGPVQTGRFVGIPVARICAIIRKSPQSPLWQDVCWPCGLTKREANGKRCISSLL